MRYALILALSVSMYAQVSSGGPGAQVESKKIVSGLRNAPVGSEAVHSPLAPLERKYLALESAMLASAAFDTYTTVRNLNHGCHEDNPMMGRHPSTAHVIAFEAAITTGEILAAHFLRKRHPKWAAAWLGESLVEHGVAGGLNTTQRCF